MVIINPIDVLVSIESIDCECIRLALKQGDGLDRGDGHHKHSYSCSAPTKRIKQKLWYHFLKQLSLVY